MKVLEGDSFLVPRIGHPQKTTTEFSMFFDDIEEWKIILGGCSLGFHHHRVRANENRCLAGASLGFLCSTGHTREKINELT
jgi:hypothetical protein